MSNERHIEELNEYREFKRNVGDRLKQLRLKKKKSQEDTAGLQIALKTYCRIEKGNVGANLQSLFFICKNLNIHPKEIFTNLPFSLNT